MSKGDKIVFWALGILFCPTVILFVLYIAITPFQLVWGYFHPALSISLEASKWRCAGTYTERVFSGKVWVNKTGCSLYKRKEQ